MNLMVLHPITQEELDCFIRDPSFDEAVKYIRKVSQ